MSNAAKTLRDQLGDLQSVNDILRGDVEELEREANELAGVIAFDAPTANGT